MAEIVDYDKSVMKKCHCKECGAIVRYGNHDIVQRKNRDYVGTVDIWDVVICPGCGADIKV